jgi:hypothetical protein
VVCGNFGNKEKLGHLIRVVQCCPTLSPFATCGDRQLLKNGFLMINKLHISQIVTKVATEKPLSPQLWRMWRQSEFGWTPQVLLMKVNFSQLL